MTTPVERPGAKKQDADLRVLLVTSTALLTVFAIGSIVQFEFVIREFLDFGFPRRLPARLLANASAVVANALLLWVCRVHAARKAHWAVLGAVAAGGLAGMVRVQLQYVQDLHPDATVGVWTTELVTAWVAAWSANLVALTFMWTRRRAEEQARVATMHELHVHYALQALAHEEIRVRREVAEGLHGSLQQRLVLISRRVQEVLEHLEDRQVTDADVALLRQAVEEMEVAREGDVREMSRLLYPDAIEIGMVPAVRSLLGRLPTSIGTRLVVSDSVRRIDDPAAPALDQTERLLVVRIVEESVTNALRHGGATRIDVAIREEGGRLQVVVTDNGYGFDAAAADPAKRSGLARLADRLAIVGGSVEVSSVPGAGATVTAWLPLGTAGEKNRS